MSRRIVALVAGLLALSGVASSCSALKDPQPFTVDLTYSEGIGGAVTIQPIRIEGDTSFGEIQIHNETAKEHGFAIYELAVFEKIPKGRSPVISLAELKNHHKYTFYCQIHRKKVNGQTVDEFRGELVINYVSEKERR